MDIMEVSIIHHISLVLVVLWIFGSLGWSHPVVFLVSFLYLCMVNERYSLRLRRKLQFEERKSANQRRLLSDSETVRWLNHAVEKIWPICMEQIASQQFLLPVIPWFLDKFKPWAANKAAVEHLYLGRNPPMFTHIRVIGQSPDDDHLVLELGMNFLSGDDMSGILAVQLRKRLGFGLWAKLHLTGMHIEGKVLVGVKFLRQWPYLGRLRVCFIEPPYFQMTVKPLFSHGLDVTELPGIAGWIDKMLDVAFGQTLVEPNMLVIDVEKFASAAPESWFKIDEKQPVAFVHVEILEAADMKPSDLNGLADPYVKGQYGAYRFQTKIQRKTLAPKWLEEFKIPISSWEAPNVLALEVRDKDPMFDDLLGNCSIDISDLRGGARHDKWVPLKNIKMGRLHVAIAVLEAGVEKGNEPLGQGEELSKLRQASTISSQMASNHSTTDASREGGQKLADEYEPIDIVGQEKTGLWVHRPGDDVPQTWEPRKGRVRQPETHILQGENGSPRSCGSSSNDSETNSNDGTIDGNKVQRLSTLKRGLRKIGSVFHRSSKSKTPIHCEEQALPTPRPNVLSVGEKNARVKVVFDDSCIEQVGNARSSTDKEDNPLKVGGAPIDISRLSEDPKTSSSVVEVGDASFNQEKQQNLRKNEENANDKTSGSIMDPAPI